MMRACVTVEADEVGRGWGRAERVAIAEVVDAAITSWSEHEVRWGDLHDSGTEGAHHARVVRFLREHEIDLVVVTNMGEDQHRMLTKMGIRVVLGATGDARAAVLAAARG
jgi:predicted Fe-Mo cluster-binding NifX family protein